MFTFKPKKVFEKLNKMDRKQAYTIGAIAVVMIVALLMLVSAATSGGEDSFDGMDSHGYDLAQMPFATDAAEQYLLASKYPDMKENGSTLLYSAAEKEQRQEEDAQAAEDESVDTDSSVGNNSDEDNYSSGYSGRGYGGYARGGGTGRGATEIGQLSHAGMASASGSGVSSTYGPSGDFRQFKGRENRGDERPAQFKTADGRQALAQFRSGSLAAARINENKMTGARKALMGGMVQGSDAFGKDGGVDLSKLQSGGFTLDTSAPSTTTDLDNLDKKVADAAKKAEEKKKEENKRKWWEDMLIDLAKQAAGSLVNSIMGTVGDTISGTIQGNHASRMAKKAEGQRLSSLDYNSLDPADKAFYQKHMQQMGIADSNWTNDDYGAAWSRMQGTKQQAKLMKNSPSALGAGHAANVKQYQIGAANNAYERAAAQERQAEEARRKAENDAQMNQQRNACVTAGKTWDAQTNTCK